MDDAELHSRIWEDALDSIRESLQTIYAGMLSGLCFSMLANAYTDHRFHNVDSLETVMAGWTATGIANADEADLKVITENLDELMYGFVNTNSVKSEYYARMLLSVSRRMDWYEREQSAAKVIGQMFWAKEQYDSAAFYYSIAMDSIEKMPVSESDADQLESFTQKEKDDVLSMMYGTLGNLYSIQDSTDLAMEYYAKAGALFDKYGWDSSNSVLYGNMGETMRNAGRLKEAENYALESLKYAKSTGDSLLVAGACSGLGGLYLDTGRTSKAMRYLNKANKYFADHEDEELLARLQSLKYTQQAMALQKKRRSGIIVLLAVVLFLAGAFLYTVVWNRKTKRDNSKPSDILEETDEAISPVQELSDITLKPREKEIVDLIAKGYTNAEIASALSLSQDTIKWYKKKLFTMFDASNSAELVRILSDKNLF